MAGAVGERIVEHLRANRGKVVTVSELVEAVYGPGGGPDYAENVVKVTVCRLRREGHAIGTKRGYYL